MTAPAGGQLAATFEQHKLPIIAGAGAAVVGLALYKRRKNVNASTAGATATDQNAAGAGSYYSTGGQGSSLTGSAGGVYDSTGSDIMGSLDPQLSSIAAQLTSIGNTLSQPLPVPAQDPTPAPVLSQPAPPTPPPAPAPAPSPIPVSQPVANPYGPQYVTVSRGDTLSGIAAKYPQSWITPSSIGSLNGIRNLNLIYPGQRLRVY